MNRVDDSEGTAQEVRRLCGEIKLFDLCDLVRCRFKDGAFCTDPKMLARFEHIADEDDSGPGRTMFVDEEDEDDFLDDEDVLGSGGKSTLVNADEDDDWDEE